MPLLDVFESDAFNVQSLTVAINKLPYKPNRIGQMGLFESKPSTNRHAVVEEKQGRLSILPTMARGSQGQTTQRGERRNIKSFYIPHVPQWDEVMAEDLEGKRAFGSENETEIFSQVLADRLQTMKNNHEVTWEWHRVGALHGIVLDNDGSTTIVNWFTEFGITQTTSTVNFADSGTYMLPAPSADMKEVCAQLYRTMQIALGGTAFDGIHVMCGNKFFDSFVRHGTVRLQYERFQEANFMRTLQIPDTPGKSQGFVFGDIAWENYRGFVGSRSFFDTTEAIAFPTGTRDIFIEVPAPADFIETVNTRGQMLYAKQSPMKWDKGIELHTQSNVLYMCTRPQCLIKLTGTNFTFTDDDLIS